MPGGQYGSESFEFEISQSELAKSAIPVMVYSTALNLDY